MANCPNCGAPLEGDANNCKFCGWVKSEAKAEASGGEIIGEKKYCSSCGALISAKAEICPKCGVRQKNTLASFVSNNEALKTDSTVSEKSRTVSLLLCLFLGLVGGHRFYVGKTGTAIVQLLLCWSGITEIWAIIDLINIICGNFTDSENKKIKVW